jgi:hypothetical protein
MAGPVPWIALLLLTYISVRNPYDLQGIVFYAAEEFHALLYCFMA